MLVEDAVKTYLVNEGIEEGVWGGLGNAMYGAFGNPERFCRRADCRAMFHDIRAEQFFPAGRFAHGSYPLWLFRCHIYAVKVKRMRFVKQGSVSFF